ncbi:MAG: formyltetrahydrofolate deformylase, partial [Arenibacter latericius]|nr:formyltetrahydrofolate deformylase [Arenibacter latericius]
MKTTILIHCPDQSGIISNVTGFIHKNGGNII